MKGFLKYHIYDRLVLFQKAIQLKFWKPNKPIIVHTMAKVGSLSVYTSLKKKLPSTALFHTHSLSVEDAEHSIRHCLENDIYPGSRSPVFLINKHILAKQKDYKIITLYRDPIERNISAFFDAFELYVGVKPEDYKGNMESLEALFHKHLPHKYPLQWFDDIFLKDTKVNVYSYPFDAELGHLTIKEEGKEILILNCYLKDDLKEKLIGEFCDISNFKLKNTNVTSNRKSGQLYSEFKNYIQFSESYLNMHYSSKYAQHFFTKNQRENAIKKWLKSE